MILFIKIINTRYVTKALLARLRKSLGRLTNLIVGISHVLKLCRYTVIHQLVNLVHDNSISLSYFPHSYAD